LQPTANPLRDRYFYGKKGGRTSVIEPERLGSSHSNNGIGIAIFDPTIRRQRSDDSMLITEVIPPSAAYLGPRRMTSNNSIPGVDWIGHRTRDTDSATMWSLPHLNHPPVTRFENLNRQVVLFCLGFILPFCWIIAAFLPLPPFRKVNKEMGGDLAYDADIEGARTFTLEDERLYENAKWWRRVNRTLSVVGLLMMGTILSLALVAATRGA
jgi:hypothetical protein